MKRFGERVRYFAFLNFGILLMAVGIYFFKAPNGFATGGVSGISIILANMIPWLSQATYMLIIKLLILLRTISIGIIMKIHNGILTATVRANIGEFKTVLKDKRKETALRVV